MQCQCAMKNRTPQAASRIPNGQRTSTSEMCSHIVGMSARPPDTAQPHTSLSAGLSNGLCHSLTVTILQLGVPRCEISEIREISEIEYVVSRARRVSREIPSDARHESELPAPRDFRAPRPYISLMESTLMCPLDAFQELHWCCCPFTGAGCCCPCCADGVRCDVWPGDHALHELPACTVRSVPPGTVLEQRHQ